MNQIFLDPDEPLDTLPTGFLPDLDFDLYDEPDNGLPKPVERYTAPGSQFLTNLTASQYEAVTAWDRPLLVLAGAGTGKTRVLTTRIAWRLEQDDEEHPRLLPAHVLALTFTHKAADEMKRRLERACGPVAKLMDIGTFHSVFAKAIRECHGHAGLSNHFTIIDETDQKALLQEAFVRNRGQEAWAACKKDTKVADILDVFSRIKMARLPFQQSFRSPLPIQDIEQLLAQYDALKRAEDVADYDDILFTFNKALDDPRILSYYQSRWRFILVDEFQDTNAVQYQILRKLADTNVRNITCVGDNDQSIYSFRQADVRNILEFEDSWYNAQVVRLEDNFRSTNNILSAANKLIHNNTARHEKTLIATKDSGSPLSVDAYDSSYTEATQVVFKIADLLNANVPPAEVAVITRTASALVSIEHQLLAAKIPYTITAGRRVADRMELKIIAAYIRAAINPTDETAFVYAFESRKRGLGKTGLSKLRDVARRADTTIEEVMRQEVATTDPKKQTSTRYTGLNAFLQSLDDLRALIEIKAAPRDIVEAIIDASEIGTIISETESKADNSASLDDRDKAKKLANSRKHNIEEILEQASQVETIEDLSTNIVLSNEKISEDKAIWLGTIHAAKGLEFAHVFLPAFEAGIMPSPQSSDDLESYDYQEERNLAYVAITRAKETLTISYANLRQIFGETRPGGPSPFISEL